MKVVSYANPKAPPASILANVAGATASIATEWLSTPWASFCGDDMQYPSPQGRRLSAKRAKTQLTFAPGSKVAKEKGGKRIIPHPNGEG